MSVSTGLLLGLVVLAALTARGRPASFLGFFCLLGLGCVIATASLLSFVRHGR